MKTVSALVLGHLRLFRVGYVSSAVFYAVYGVVFAIFFYNTVFDDDELRFLADLVVVSFMQILGLGFNKFNLSNPFRSDPYTRLMRVLRMLPIPTEHLAAARMIPIFLLSAVNLFLLYVPAYGIYSNIHEAITFPQLLSYLFLLYLACVAFACFYAYLEIGFGGRVYFVVSLILISGIIAVTVVLGLNGFHLSGWLLQRVQDGMSPMVYVASTAVTALIIYMLWRLSSRRLAHRDYYDYRAVS